MNRWRCGIEQVIVGARSTRHWRNNIGICRICYLLMALCQSFRLNEYFRLYTRKTATWMIQLPSHHHETVSASAAGCAIRQKCIELFASTLDPSLSSVRLFIHFNYAFDSSGCVLSHHLLCPGLMRYYYGSSMPKERNYVAPTSAASNRIESS